MSDVFLFLWMLLIVGSLSIGYLIYKTSDNGSHKE